MQKILPSQDREPFPKITEGRKGGREEGRKADEFSRFVFNKMCSTNFFSYIVYHIRNKILLPKIWHNHGMGQELSTSKLLLEELNLFKSGSADRSWRLTWLTSSQMPFLVSFTSRQRDNPQGHLEHYSTQEFHYLLSHLAPFLSVPPFLFPWQEISNLHGNKN